jgi:transcriptional regulator with XRE-family HTH domain
VAACEYRRKRKSFGALDLTQEELVDRLSVAQSNISRLERRRDMLISTLQEEVPALGGELRLTAVFPDGVVEINQFQVGGSRSGPAKFVQTIHGIARAAQRCCDERRIRIQS